MYYPLLWVSCKKRMAGVNKPDRNDSPVLYGATVDSGATVNNSLSPAFQKKYNSLNLKSNFLNFWVISVPLSVASPNEKLGLFTSIGFI